MHRLYCICAVLLLLSSCQKEAELLVNRKIPATPDVRADDTIIKEKGYYFSRLYKANSNGIAGHYELPGSINDKEVVVICYGRIRTNYAFSNSYIRISVTALDGEILAWTGFYLKQQFTENNEWCTYRDSVILKHESWQKPYKYLSVFAGLENSTHELFDIDTLCFTVKTSERR